MIGKKLAAIICFCAFFITMEASSKRYGNDFVTYSIGDRYERGIDSILFVVHVGSMKNLWNVLWTEKMPIYIKKILFIGNAFKVNKSAHIYFMLFGQILMIFFVSENWYLIDDLVYCYFIW